MRKREAKRIADAAFKEAANYIIQPPTTSDAFTWKMRALQTQIRRHNLIQVQARYLLRDPTDQEPELEIASSLSPVGSCIYPGSGWKTFSTWVTLTSQRPPPRDWGGTQCGDLGTQLRFQICLTGESSESETAGRGSETLPTSSSEVRSRRDEGTNFGKWLSALRLRGKFSCRSEARNRLSFRGRTGEGDYS